jgi:hypothetical protein
MKWRTPHYNSQYYRRFYDDNSHKKPMRNIYCVVALAASEYQHEVVSIWSDKARAKYAYHNIRARNEAETLWRLKIVQIKLNGGQIIFKGLRGIRDTRQQNEHYHPPSYSHTRKVWWLAIDGGRIFFGDLASAEAEIKKRNHYGILNICDLNQKMDESRAYAQDMD